VKFSVRFFCKIFLQDFSATFFSNIFQQHFSATFSGGKGEAVLKKEVFVTGVSKISQAILSLGPWFLERKKIFPPLGPLTPG